MAALLLLLPPTSPAGPSRSKRRGAAAAAANPWARPPPLLPVPPARRRRMRAALVAGEKPAICTADELHHVPVSGSPWNLALWRYLPSPNAIRRNHPLLLLSGVGTNAIGYDLSPEASFARHMSSQGFDTWILEVRGAGLSARQMDYEEATQSVNGMSDWTESVMLAGQSSNMVGQLRDLSQKLVDIIGKGQNMVPPPLVGLQERLSSTLEDFQKQLDVIENYDWDFDHYLEEDVPTAVRWIT